MEFRNTQMGKPLKVLITGATGFVGTTLLRHLISLRNYEICCLARNISRLPQEVKAIDCSVAGWNEKVIEWHPEVVIHLAAHFTGRSQFADIPNLVQSNITFTAEIAETVTHCSDFKLFINSGTFTEFADGAGIPRPNNLYSATKAAVRPILQYYCEKGGWKWANVIIYSPYGRRNSKKKVIDYLCDALESPVPVSFSPGEQILDFIHVDDMADFFSTLISKNDRVPQGFTQWHLGTGQGHTLREVAAIMEEISGRKVNAVWGGRDYNPEDPMYAVAPQANNINSLDWSSKISLRKGLEIYLKERNIIQ